MTNKVAIITAGADGIGYVTAKTFMDNGYRVAICDVNGDAVHNFRQNHPEHMAVVLNVVDENGVQDFVKSIYEQYNRIDVLVNNAGTGGASKLVEDFTYEEFKTCMSINIDGAFLFTREVMPIMKAQKSGSIVNMSSTGGQYGYANRSPYCAAKWAVIGLTQTWAAEAGTHNVRVNAIAPGSVAGDRMDRVIANDAKVKGVSEQHIRDSYTATSAMGDFVEKQDIADTIFYLCGDGAKRVSGQCIAVDGYTDTLRT